MPGPYKEGLINTIDELKVYLIVHIKIENKSIPEEYDLKPKEKD